MDIQSIDDAHRRVARHLDHLPIAFGPGDRLVLLLMATAYPFDPLCSIEWIAARLGLPGSSSALVRARLDRLRDAGLIQLVQWAGDDLPRWTLSPMAMGLPDTAVPRPGLIADEEC